MSTVGTIVRAALRQIQVAKVSAAEMEDAIEALNFMLQDWSSSPNAIYVETRESFNVTDGTGSYTIGSGATFDTTRPTRILSAFIRKDSTDYPVEIIDSVDFSQWDRKSDEARPYELYYERSYANGTILLLPVPDQTYALHLNSQKPFSSYSTSGDSLGLPPEYETAIKYNLALHLAPEFGAQVSQITVTMAQITMKNIKNLNAQPVEEINTDPLGNGGNFDINTGTSR